jgi:hypothetical protein
MWLARGMALMALARYFPYLLIVILAISVVSLWAAVSIEATAFVQVFYVTTIFISFSVFVVGFWSSAACVFKRFEKYWVSGYPIMLVVAYMAYGMFKSSLELIILAIFVSTSALGYLIGGRFAEHLYRFIPMTTCVMFLVASELPIEREIRVSVFGVCIGLLLVPIIRYRFTAFSRLK